MVKQRKDSVIHGFDSYFGHLSETTRATASPTDGLLHQEVALVSYLSLSITWVMRVRVLTFLLLKSVRDRPSTLVYWR